MDQWELFDLQNDPEEMTNLAGDPQLADLQRDLFSDLETWIKSQTDQLTVFHEPLMLDEPETWLPRK
jgi:uncharacterized sulfatase